MDEVMMLKKQKMALLMALGMSLVGCGEFEVRSAKIETVYDCSVLSKEEKRSLSEMYERCDIKDQYGNNCKSNAREALCKPTIYLIPESYNGENIKPALSQKAAGDVPARDVDVVPLESNSVSYQEQY